MNAPHKRAWTFSLVKDFNEIAPHLPDWFMPIGEMIETARQNKTFFNEHELAFRILGRAKPLQQYLLRYLQTDYITQADDYLAAPPLMNMSKIISKLLNAGTYMDDHQEGIRHTYTLPMTRAQAVDAASELGSNKTIQRTAAALQVCLDQYTDAVNEQLVRHYGFHEKSDACNLLSVAKSSEAVWADFTQFLSLSAQNKAASASPFAQAFKTALTNQAFQSRRGHAVKICPGQSLAKHFLNTDVVETAEGTYTIAKAPRDGALPHFLYQKLNKQPAALTFTL